MTLEALARRGRELQAKTRLELIQNIWAEIGAVAFSAWGYESFYLPVQRVMFAVAMAWAVAGAYFVNRGVWEERRPGDGGFVSGLEFYKWEVERRVRVFQRVLVWTFGPLFLALMACVSAAWVAAGGEAVRLIPFGGLGMVWLVAVYVMRRSTRREMARDVQELGRAEAKLGKREN